MKRLLLVTLIAFSNVFFTKTNAQSNPEICMVTVDANSTHNIVFYDKTNHGDAAFYIIYREDQAGNYIALDSIHKDTLSEYHDMTALVNVRAHKYKISLVDTFGVESALSPFHRTVFCDEPSTGLFAWNWYGIEGQSNPSTDWVMLREDIAGSTGWMAVDTIPGSAVDFFDTQIASFPLGTWRVRKSPGELSWKFNHVVGCKTPFTFPKCFGKFKGNGLPKVGKFRGKNWEKWLLSPF